MKAMTDGLAEWCRRRNRRQRTVRMAIGAAAVVAVMVITVLPAPDGRYVSDIRAREETLHTIDQTFFAQL